MTLQAPFAMRATDDLERSALIVAVYCLVFSESAKLILKLEQA